MYYAVRHITHYHYAETIREGITEARLQPRSEGHQHNLHFELATSPKARVLSHHDYLQNMVHTFSIPRDHQRLTIASYAIVELHAPPILPNHLLESAWAAIDEQTQQFDYYDFTQPSHFVQFTPLLCELMSELGSQRHDDPLTFLKALNSKLYHTFAYVQNTTDVNSPIDDALGKRAGVCQDFTHIMLAIVRYVGIPARYVSGYLYHRRGNHDRSVNDASHAWLEAWLPNWGWIGFDPTNNLICKDRHIRVGVGRDYADVPPTRGTFKGKPDSRIEVEVQVEQLDELPSHLNLQSQITLPENDGVVAPSTFTLAMAEQQQQ